MAPQWSPFPCPQDGPYFPKAADFPCYFPKQFLSGHIFQCLRLYLNSFSVFLQLCGNCSPNEGSQLVQYKEDGTNSAGCVVGVYPVVITSSSYYGKNYSLHSNKNTNLFLQYSPGYFQSNVMKTLPNRKVEALSHFDTVNI